MDSAIFATAVRALTPLIVLLSAYFFVRGHDSPGGGFIAGLIAAAAVVLRRFSTERSTGPLTRASGHQLVAVGLMVAIVSGTLTLGFNGSFLGPAIWRGNVVLFGEVKLTISMLFDVGVYLVVVGVVASIVRYLGEASR